MPKLVRKEIAARAVTRHEAEALYPGEKNRKKRDDYVDDNWWTTWWLMDPMPPVALSAEESV